MFWAYQSLQAQMFGTHGNVHQPTIWAARGRLGGGKNLPKLERGQLFGPLKGGRWITAGDCSPIVGMPRYRSGSPIDTANHFDWLAPLGSASKNSSKLEFWALFPPTGPAKHASERTPFPPKLGHRTASRGGGGGRNRPKLEFWRLFGRRHLFKSSRIQDGHAPRRYFHRAVSRSPTATTTLRHTACGSMVATGYAKTRAAFEFWRLFCS